MAIKLHKVTIYVLHDVISNYSQEETATTQPNIHVPRRVKVLIYHLMSINVHTFTHVHVCMYVRDTYIYHWFNKLQTLIRYKSEFISQNTSELLGTKPRAVLFRKFVKTPNGLWYNYSKYIDIWSDITI